MNTLLIDGTIGLDITPLDVSNFLSNANGNDVLIQINSPGGLLYDAISIHNLLKSYQGKITCEIIGLAASSASFISTAADEVIVYPNSIYMVHNPWLVSVGDHHKLRADANHIEKLSNFLLNAYASKTGKSFDELKNLLNSETYFFGSEIVFNKFADKIVFDESSQPVPDDVKNSLISAAKDSVSFSLTKLNESILASVDYKNAIDILSTPSQLPESPTGSSDASTTASQVLSPDDKGNPDDINSINIHIIKSQLDFVIDIVANIESSLKSFAEKFNPIFEVFSPDPDDVPPSDLELGLEPEPEPEPEPKSLSLPVDFFEYRLNALLDSNKILPSHKKIILDLISELNSSAQPENIYQLIINLISTPVSDLSSSLNQPDFHTSFNPDNYFGLDVDPQSREYHKQILAIQKEHNCSYITAATIFINSRKD